MNEKQRRILEEWRDDARLLLHAHFSHAERCRHRHYWLGVPAAILSALVGTTVFAALSKEPALAFKIAVGIVSVLASVLATLATFLNYADDSSKHHQTAASYASIRKHLDEVLSEDSVDDVELKKLFTDIRSKWDETRKSALPLSHGTLKKYRTLLNISSQAHIDN